ncbi:MAG: hypothetical protein JWN99_2602 [Ilumatobacteraceae bacterium]|nr:hypothetical protein [Ilumatobacteraceae bacterium]
MATAVSIEPIPERVDRRVLALLQTFLRSLRRAGRNPFRTARGELERAARAFDRRIVSDSVAAPRPVEHRDDLLRVLTDEKHAIAIEGATTAIAAVKLLERFGPLKVIAKRTPWLLAATSLPAIYSAFARGADELAVVSSYLTNRASAAGTAADPDRVRRVSVQLLQDRRVDADDEPVHRDLVSSWARRAVRGMLPFSHVGAARRARTLAAAAAAIDPTSLTLVV